MSDAQEQFEQLFAMREANCPEAEEFAGRPPAKTASSGENSGTVRPAEPKRGGTMPLTQSGRKLLSSDEIVERASDVHAETCGMCHGGGFVETEILCPVCSGSGAVLVHVEPPEPVAYGRTILAWSLFFLSVAAIVGAIIWEGMQP